MILKCTLVLLAVLGLCACGNAPQSNTDTIATTQYVEQLETVTEEEQRICLTIIRDDEGNSLQGISQEELCGLYDGAIYYPQYSDILIEIDGENMPLRKAILDGHISVEDFAAAIYSDARNGFCEENYGSNLGLTYFLYKYKTFEVAIFNDIWEAANGESLLVREIHIWEANKFNPSSIGRTYINSDGLEESYRHEDWGLSFDVLSVEPTNLSIKTTQSGGQQLGQLQITYVTMITCDTGEFLRKNGEYTITPVDRLITMEGDTELVFDWNNCLGALPSGKYILSFEVTDQYDSDTVHPLMKNYTDQQFYHFWFDIP